ncbi:MAG: UDP-N-acetylmuramoyl-L-alanyl-D-glutamate--2,6-diaminopimelate ligase [Candidatus Eisenbacteria bacterium]|uniref:UDP-N-acetylmuramoyl-L-alanyl-D-glutamate--2,6-diaminopimelate ligase n=1 Tax=Eiseniibacteriota bacterium TaxID=2212470 RepID=A0A948RY37_UNCEI|nr:UDP-N-acetylmuramoyl-L-alanyl-D-glutamate--2,6-diaminopimelate ligase [Candidatus Eisenbacteria bacterium]MBU1950409.1 UDP-N-acetylmuramoyl-L-alanyl-D-glutamate--2,6-diaminopimelate ligase [Candidatus Eisenbacteria bacterium]MBU2692970.1 UDP-N-acetylmuramoyl-L-alanyl-D-glutamate--2,6-diaminopimelate ligase [Candidatus Eisenbacteria bacterium]
MHHDSRAIQPGSIFVGIKGKEYDGRSFVRSAIEAGAALIVSDTDPQNKEIPWIQTPAPRKALAYLSDAFYGHPSGRMDLIAATGTNGKTSVCWLLREALVILGFPAASLGTLGASLAPRGKEKREIAWPSHTTPEAPAFQKTLYELLESGITHVACEVSSHALAMDRILGTQFRIVLFTLFGRDHLDFHQTVENYRASKWKLFTPEGRGCIDEVPPAAVINVDDPEGRRLAEALLGGDPSDAQGGQSWPVAAGSPLVTHGLTDEGHPWLRGEILEAGSHGLLLRVMWPGGSLRLRSPLLGRFQATHLLAVLSALLVLGVSGKDAADALAKSAPVPGRMECITRGPRGVILVDYAHTPEALETVLRESRAMADSKVYVVFGCGGERDSGKRPLMGLAAGQMADEVIITTDNPRREDPERIVAQILEGLRVTSAHHEVIMDRREALRSVIPRLEPGDLLLVAGRGAETIQDFGREKIPFDDRQVVREILLEISNDPAGRGLNQEGS